MKIMYYQVADNRSSDKARKGEDVGDGIDVFVGCEEVGEGSQPREWVSRS